MTRWWGIVLLVAFGCDERGSVDQVGGTLDLGAGQVDAATPRDAAPPDVGEPEPIPDRGVDQGERTDMRPGDMDPPDQAVDAAIPCVPGDERACANGCVGGRQTCNEGHWSECVAPPERCNGFDDDCDGRTDEDFADLGDPCAVGIGACADEAAVVCAADGAGTQCGAVLGPASVEVCDRADNDCDGTVDENTASACYDGPVAAAGVGACRLGVAACAGGEPGDCVGAIWPDIETCNGVDDDCDGRTDEGIAPMPCYDAPPETVGVGVCRAGQRLCVEGAFGACVDQVRPGVEICDGLDNDCNGQRDDVPPDVDCECRAGDARPCYAGPPETRNIGVCRDGVQRCGPDNRYGACVDERQPGDEICDGGDNDCDGQVDEAVAGAGGQCEVGIGACIAYGERVCDAASGRLRCSVEPLAPSPERCNGIDDDCDGLADDGFGLGEPCVAGAGACLAVGRRICGPDGEARCDAEAGDPVPELCDGADNDCDGVADEGFGLGDACSAGAGRCRREGVIRCTPDGQARCTAQAGAGQIEACNTIDDDCDGRVDENNPGGGQACVVEGIGECAFGTRICTEGAFVCVVEGAPAVERCDGADNDCDGIADEGDDGGLLQQVCYGGPDDTEGVGPCVAGVRTCVDAEFGPCAGEVVPAAEVCNQRDDDCDGLIDDLDAGDCVCEPGARRRCVIGAEETVGVGACRAGEQVCGADGMGFGPCEGAIGPAVEVCDGIDNDCNGMLDDVAGRGFPCQVGAGICQRRGLRFCDLELGQLACAVEPGAPEEETCDGRDEDCDGVVDELPRVGEQCGVGVGACRRDGNLACDPASGDVVCPAVAGAPEAEICNGVDDDCDGQADEALATVGNPCTVGQGVCARDGAIICDGVELRCDASPGNPAPERCDTVDNDCDGRIDEGADGGACEAGVGACATPGVLRCTPDGLACDAQPGDAGLEVCNGIDDDCDGRADEQLFCRAFVSCQAALDAGFGTDGVYRLDPDGDGEVVDVYCDQTTDGGGWTLVASSADQTPNDQGGPWHPDLRTLAPEAGHAGVWSGLRGLLAGGADLRFACRDRQGAADDPLTVDVSVYDADWYGLITTGNDAASCFRGGPIPARRDNRLGAIRTADQGWSSETDDATGFVGEDECGDTADFSVDFDDRGMNANQSDGTDWGEDDGAQKCGRNGVGAGQWFVYAREPRRGAPLAQVALIGPRALAAPLEAGGFAVTAFDIDNLPRPLDLTGFDVVFLGRINGRWARLTANLRDALFQYSAQGGNLVTEYDGLIPLATTLRADMRFRDGAPQPPWGWFPIAVGAGGRRAVDTPISRLEQDDPTVRGLGDVFALQSGSESFFTVYPVDQGVDTLLRKVGEIPGLAANPAFPGPTHPAVLRGARCGGNVIIAPFDYQDAAGLAPGVRFIQNLAATAASPPPPDLVDVCPPPRPRLMVCGRADVDVRRFLPADGPLIVAAGCQPGDDVQALLITRNAPALDGDALAAWVERGGRVVTELGVSDRVYSAIFGIAVDEGPRRGRCRDNPMPAIRFNPSDRLWQRVDFAPSEDTGCGHDMAGWPGITALGGWTAQSVSLAYRRHGRGVVWLVEADWQDGQGTLTDASRVLMSYLITGRRTAGLSLGGPWRDLLLRHAEQGGFSVCATASYGGPLDLADVRADCDRDVLMLACRRTGRATLSLAGMGRRSDVLGAAIRNGLQHYQTPEAWGFGPAGAGIELGPCDIDPDQPEGRLCWNVAGDRLTPGFRCGANLVDDGSFERVILHRTGAVIE